MRSHEKKNGTERISIAPFRPTHSIATPPAGPAATAPNATIDPIQLSPSIVKLVPPN